jgi:hypothetical protein
MEMHALLVLLSVLNVFNAPMIKNVLLALWVSNLLPVLVLLSQLAVPQTVLNAILSTLLSA